MDASDIVEHEQVHVLDINNGNRFITYAIPGARGSGQICINGAAAHLVTVGDLVIICSYVELEESERIKHEPRIVHVDAENKVTDHALQENSVMA